MKKILVIDYDQASLAALHKILSQEGFEVVLAGDGQAGWEKFQSEKPDLVLMEAMLSKIHGFELCDRITKDPVRKVPVFIMTGVYKDRVYRTEALRTYGASEYFEKPLDMLKFVASIHGVLTLPDIKPSPEVKPGNGEPAETPESVPVVRPVKEEPRRVETPPEVRPAKSESPRTRPVPSPRPAMDEGLSLESVLNVRPAKEEHRRPEPGFDIVPPTTVIPKVKAVPDGKPAKEDEFRLETLLNIMPEKEEHRRPETSKGPASPHTVPKSIDEKSHEQARKEHGAEAIDKLLKTTLADFGLESDKKKTAKAFPQAAPAAVPAPEKPKAAAPAPPVQPAFEKPKVAAPPPPPPAPQKPKPFQPQVQPAAPPEKPKMAAPAPPVQPAFEKPKVAAPPPPPPAPQKPKSFQPQVQPAAPPEKPKPASPPPMPAAVAEKPKPPQTAAVPPRPKVEPRPEPKPTAEKKAAAKEAAREKEPQKAAETRMFKDIYEVDKKKSPAPFIAVGAGLVIVAAVGYFLLRPKAPFNPAGNLVKNSAMVIPSAPLEKSPDTSLPSLSEEKLRAVNPKAKAGAQANQNRPVEPLPTAEDAIVPSQSGDISRLAIPATAANKPEIKPAETKPAEAKTSDTKAEDTKPAETQGAQTQGRPPAKTEATPPQGSAGSGDQGGSEAPQAARANPGDLVDLAAADEQPKILKSVEPAYPTQAQRFGKEGAVTVNALIDESGNVVNTGILKGLKDDMGIEKAAADAVRKWKFQPAKKDGVNVKVWKPIVITFKASRSRTN
jgi:TonB family protein